MKLSMNIDKYIKEGEETMSFYSQIADYYTYIFPLSHGQLNFILSKSPDSKQMKLLEVGCGIGELSLELGKHFGKVVGIDLDETMIMKAINQPNQHCSNVSFYCLNMLHLEHQFNDDDFDRVICFGNTLVHLLEDREIAAFFEQSRKILRDKGRLMFQILNYDYILEHHVTQLPVIENDTLRFERFYEYPNDQALINFHTSLLIKKSGLSFSNTIPLNPARKSTIENLLKLSGYTSYQFFGSYNQDSYDNNSEILLCEAEK